MNIQKIGLNELGSTKLMENEIENVKVIKHCLKKGEIIVLDKNKDFARVLFLVLGSVKFITDELTVVHSERALFLPKPEALIELKGEGDCSVLEIQIRLNDKQWQDYTNSKKMFPVSKRYDEFLKYKEDCKSEKTISRIIVEPDTIPNLAIGSVETYGEDRVGKHKHPYVEQLFYNFEESDMMVEIDDEAYPVSKSTILHIPLGSSHGVYVKEGWHTHYLWMDYVIDEKGLEYIEEAHEIIE